VEAKKRTAKEKDKREISGCVFVEELQQVPLLGFTELTGINTLTECAGVSADSDECSTYSLGASKAKEIVHAVLFYE
jgi:hypothetical protein